MVIGGYKERSQHKNKYDYSGKPAAIMRAEAAAYRDAQPLTVTCAFCGWTTTASAGESRDAAREHRQAAHPEACIRKPRQRRRVWIKRGDRTAEHEAQATLDAAEANRVRAEREDAVRLAKVLAAQARDAA